MSDPLVCCVMLTRDRPEMAARAVRCFREQTYTNKWLLVYNTGDDDDIECGCNAHCYHVMDRDAAGLTIGALRNKALTFKSPYHPPADIFIHWDDDDLSHPNRIAEQVALLQASGAECVGYSEMLFWREPLTHPSVIPESFGEAWLYTDLRPQPSYCLGTSLCYWRRVWEKRPFPEMNNVTGSGRGEDGEWLKGVDSLSVSAMQRRPRMIATIHAGNAKYYGGLGQSPNWKRVPQWDEYCRERCAL